MTHLRALSLLFLASGAPAAPQAFDALPGEPSQYTVDRARWYYPTPEAEASAREALTRELKLLKSKGPRARESAANLAEGISVYESVLVQHARLEANLYLEYATDTRKQDALDAERALGAQVETATEAFLTQVAKLEPGRLEQFLKDRPALEPYGFFLRRARQTHPSAVAADDKALSELAPLVEGWQSDLHELALADVPRADFSSADPAARKASYQMRREARARRRDIVAFALLHLVAARNALARVHGYPDAVTEAYAKSEWTRAQVDELLDKVSASAPMYKRYERLRAQRVAQLGGPADAGLWDASMEWAPRKFEPRFTLDGARALLLEVLKPLGPAYGEQLSALLDPKNRRLDLSGGPNRKRAGFSKGFVGVESVFYSWRFDGSYEDLRRLTHESTHAIQRQLQSDNGVKPANADGPHWEFEGTAVFNELMLADALEKRATTPEERRFYLEQFLGGKGLDTIFVAAAEAMLEERIYDGVAKGAVKTADDLDALTLGVWGRFSIWPEREPTSSDRWMTIPLLYEDPFYDVNYAWAGLVGLEFLRAHEKEPGAFGKRYTALLQNAFDRPVADLLRKFTGVDVASPVLVEDALQVAAARVDSLEAAYRE